MSETYTDQQFKNMNCSCIIHRYHVAHVCECGKLYSHSQTDCDTHRGHKCVNIPARDVNHGMTAWEAFELLAVRGTLPYGTESFQAVYDYFASKQVA